MLEQVLQKLEAGGSRNVLLLRPPMDLVDPDDVHPASRTCAYRAQ
jgi:hypothetical protein